VPRLAGIVPVSYTCLFPRRTTVVDTLAQLQALLGERYALERELGRGGTATVYLARESKHEREVAVKVLRPDIGALLGAGRFLHEIKLTSRLQHPHILPLYDSGEAEGLIYYVMPYVEGESLRDRLRREKRLPIGDVLRIAREVADALAYAHSHNVVHRDIKPENILLTGGHALVADFGIARAISRAGGEAWETVTSSGVVVGTPAYMSPEQASGERELNGRSDIYSLGCVLYEMLTGDAPFIGPDGELRLARRFTERAPSVRAVRETVPEHVDAAVAKALERDPADRFASVQELADALFGAPITAPSTTLGRPATRRRALWLASGVVAAAAVLSTLWLTARQPRAEKPAASAVATATDSAERTSRVQAVPLQPPPARDTTAEQRAAASTAPRADSLAPAARAAALKARRAAAEAGATAAELAPGDASLASAEGLARAGRHRDAMRRLSSSSTAWAEAERAARARAAATVQQQTQARAPAVAQPNLPTTQPAPPPPAAPVVVDQRPVIESVIAEYARAIGSRDVAAIRRVYPGLTTAQQQAWEQFFESVETVKASFSIAQLDLSDGTAEASVVGTYDYVNTRSGRAEHRPVSFRATLRREGAAWRISAVR
jgi:predicted Ser/Thr protein kinase